MITSLLLHCMLLVLARAVDTTASDIVTTTSTVPPYPRQTGIVSECNRYYRVLNGDNCWSITRHYGINIDDFYHWNPAVGPACETLWVGYYVCIGVWRKLLVSTTTYSANPLQNTSTIPETYYDYSKAHRNLCISKPVGNSTELYRVFMQWNPSVGNECQNLLAGYCYCVSAPPVNSQTSQPST
ncbi:predicted protein [Aspergillus terreus NIH2624]|uniref:LysM domain-containing protein n=1 Tax=Aspergillus terreus (strain NIH 2624 / FGSC A1156) TaxID=341663 RepID=Q0C8I5_ASPTN|nr:uncharacterized protein ATEG_09999 [Aspergillus terreus NIH2624]EAU29448.1 predicted protein [Aspergillus terreus NIH2624]